MMTSKWLSFRYSGIWSFIIIYEEKSLFAVRTVLFFPSSRSDHGQCRRALHGRYGQLSLTCPRTRELPLPVGVRTYPCMCGTRRWWPGQSRKYSSCASTPELKLQQLMPPPIMHQWRAPTGILWPSFFAHRLLARTWFIHLIKKKPADPSSQQRTSSVQLTWRPAARRPSLYEWETSTWIMVSSRWGR
jgi:hypothetical protein